MTSKAVLINKIDVKYREIENLDFQYEIMSKILSKFEIAIYSKFSKFTINIFKFYESENCKKVVFLLYFAE